MLFLFLRSWKFAIFVHCSDSTSRCYIKHCTKLHILPDKYVQLLPVNHTHRYRTYSVNIEVLPVLLTAASAAINISDIHAHHPTCKMISMNRPKCIVFSSVAMQSTSSLENLCHCQKGEVVSCKKELFAIHRTHSGRRAGGTQNWTFKGKASRSTGLRGKIAGFICIWMSA